MTKRTIFTIAVEGALETEKMLNGTGDAASNSSDFGSLYDKVSAQVNSIDRAKEMPDSVSGSSDSSSSDTSSDDSGSDDASEGSGDDSGSDDMDFDMDEGMEDTGDDESKDKKDDVEKDAGDDKDNKDKDKDDSGDKEEKSNEDTATENAVIFAAVTLESLESEFKVIYSNAAMESGESSTGEKIWEGMKSVGAAMVVAGQALAYVGVNIVWPVMKRLYKVLIYLGAKFIRHSFHAIEKIEKLKEQHTNRVSKLKDDLFAASEIVKLLIEKESKVKGSVPDKIDTTFTKIPVINRIKIGDKHDPVEVMNVLESFLTKWYSKTSKDIEKDSAAIKHVLHYGINASLNPVKVFGDSSMRSGLVPDNRQTHEIKNGFVDSLRWSEVLPGDMFYCCAVPNGKAQTIDDIRLAYGASSCSFAMEAKTFKDIGQVDYMNLSDVVASLQSVERIIKILDKQEEVYERLKKEKSSYMTSFKRYLLGLAESDKKITLEQSMMEYVYLRGAFIDNVYTVTARDIHDFTQRYLANVMTYLRSNLEELSS